MRRGSLNVLIIVFSVVLFCACSNTKHLPANEKLYTGANIVVKGASSVKQGKALTEDLEGLTRPKPNSKILGVRLKLSIYNLWRNKKPKSFFGKLRDKFGEPPVLLSQVDLKKNTQVLQNYVENKGYFRAVVTADTIVNKRKRMARVRYGVYSGPQYTIGKVSFEGDSNILLQRIKEDSTKSLLIPGKPFDLDVIKGERNRIDAALKEKGFFYFAPDYLLVQTDTTVGNHKADLYVVVKPETPNEARNVYFIDKVYIYSNYSLRANQSDTSKQQAQYYKGYYVIDPKNTFKPSLFEQAMQFNPGDIYKRSAHNQTLNRLISLNLFRFTKNRFEPVTINDTTKLDAYYYLTPQLRKSFTGEVDLTTKSNNASGSQITLGWRNRNAFRGGEQLSLSGYLGTELQYNGALQGYNTYRTGAQFSLSVPRFIVPFYNIHSRGGYIPRTNFRLGYDILTRTKLYALNSYRFSYGYQWKENIMINHELNPISIVYVQPLNVSKRYSDSIRNNPFLRHVIDTQFILGGNYQYTYNQAASGFQPVNSYYFNGLIDLSGNIAGLVSGANVKAGKQVTIGNLPFAQYIKLETDARYYRKLGLHTTWANRIDIGFGLPYGNSLELPFIKQFFVGGNSSLRGFRSRSVGPGTYHYPDTTGFLPDQTGDIKLEINTELRPRISGPLYGAIFIDAGNVWLYNENPNLPGSKFTGKFLSQLAIDAGVGARLDIQLFVIRLDVAVPIRKPWVTPPLVTNQIQFKSNSWRRENLIFNLAIGYPF